MAGNPDNAALWAEADVYVAPLGTAAPTDGSAVFPVGWVAVGLLDGDDGFTTTRDQDTNDLYAWGGILVRTSRAHFKLTKGFSVLEDNVTTRSLIWPGSTAGTIVVPRPESVLLAFETREPGTGKVHRLITANSAQVDVDGDVTENETDLTKYALVATIFPTGDGTLFTEQVVPPAAGGGALAAPQDEAVTDAVVVDEPAPAVKGERVSA